MMSMSMFMDFFPFFTNATNQVPSMNNVSITTAALTDYSRSDPYAPIPTPRALMVSVFQPATCDRTISVPYMPDETAHFQSSLLRHLFQVPDDPSLFLDARLTVCSEDAENFSLIEDVPTLLFSPGYTIPRHYYNHLASAVARQGFTVITIDHPYDANIVTYPDGHSVYNPDTAQNPAAWKEHLPVRAEDASFIIDQLGNETAMAELLPHRRRRAFSTDQRRIAMFGHSLGGAASVIAAGRDPRILGAINWDGTFVVSPPEEGISKPVLLISREATDDGSWPATWPLLKGPKLWAGVSGADHLTFSDVPLLMKQKGRDPGMSFAELGGVEPEEMMRMLVVSTRKWMQGVFDRKDKGRFMEGQHFGEFAEGFTVMMDNF